MVRQAVGPYIQLLVAHDGAIERQRNGTGGCTRLFLDQRVDALRARIVGATVVEPLDDLMQLGAGDVRDSGDGLVGVRNHRLEQRLIALPTYASTQTIFTILKANWYYMEQKKFLEWDVVARADVVVPGQHETAIAVPWGGTAHPVWFRNDPRVANCKAMGGVLARPVMENVVATTQMVKEKIKPLSLDQQEQELGKIAATLQASMPPRENPRINTSVDSVYASGPLGRKHVVIHGNCNYKQTGMLQAYAAYHLTQQAPNRVGFASGCQAFGHQTLLGQLRSFGLVMNPVVTMQE